MDIKNLNQEYYNHIDGLRAIAVIAVLLAHLDFLMFEGGFIGVDVFFVISGFLITKIILREIENTQNFSFLNFYTRRIRRIMPALIFTLLFSFLGSVWLLNLARFTVFGGSLSAAVLSVANIFFYKQAGYFDIFSQSTPLLHMWSLGVEEQFYIFWPIFLIITFKLLRKHFLFLVVSIFTISLVLNLIYHHKDINALYYFVQYRAFEFCIGAFCVWLVQHQVKKNILLEILCMLGFLLIIYPILAYNSKTLFPSYNALLPTIGTALIIYGGTARFSGSVLRTLPVRFIGLISYSLYLIHWPLIVFFKTYNENIGLPFEISFKSKIVIIFLSIIIATMMYYFIEQPFRKSIPKDKCKQRSLILRWIGIVAIIAMAGAKIFYSNGWLWRATFPVEASKITDISKYHEQNWGGAGFSGEYIYKGKSGAPSIVMMGDSNAGMLDEGITKEIAEPLGLTVFTASGGGAGKYTSSLLLPGITRLDANQSGFDESAKTCYGEVVSKLSESENSILIYSADYSFQINNAAHLDTHLSLGINTSEMDKYEDYKPFIEALDKLREKIKGHKLVIIGNVPKATKYDTMKCLTRLKWFKDNACLPEQPESTTNIGSINVNKILNEYAQKHEGVYFINPYDIFCKNGMCLNVSKEGVPLYSDGGHLSKEGSRYFISQIKPILLKIMSNPS